MGGAGLLLLVFPDGRLYSRRWRWALAPLVLGLAFIAVSGVLGWPLRGSLHAVTGLLVAVDTEAAR